MSSFQVFGIASGLDTGNIIDQLMQIERRPLDLLERRESRLNSQLSLFQEFNTSLSSLLSAVKSVGDSDNLKNVTATSSNEDALEATGGSSGNLGSFDITINSLAQQSVIIQDLADTITDADSTTLDAFGVTSGTITVSDDGGATTSTVTIDATTDTLNDLRDAINELGLNVAASVVEVDGDGTDYRLVITGAEEGTANQVVIADGTSNAASTLGVTTEDQAAADASITLAGQTIVRSSNTITDVIDGVTLTLKDDTASPTATVQVVSDSSANLKQIESFVDAFNDTRQFVVDQTKFTEGADSQPALFGDRTLISIDSELRSLLTNRFTSLSDIQSLSQLGVTFNTGTGLFEVDTSEVTDNLENNPTAVINLFGALKDSLTNTSNTGPLDRMTNSVDGRVKTKTDFLQVEIDSLNDSQERMEARLDRRRALLERQFLAMEQAIAQMQSQQSQFQNALSSLGSGSSSGGGGIFG